ncbi:MAG: ribose-phosphate pyrophosphokinase [Patescibacteria group bacterium]
MKRILLSGSSNNPLAKKIALKTGIRLGRLSIKKFRDGEKYVNVGENLKEKEVIILQSGSMPADEHLVELLLILDAVKRLRPKKIIVLLPFYPYRRQEKESQKGDAISAELIGGLLQACKIDKLVVVDLHSPVIKGFYKIPVKEISAIPLFVKYFQNKKIDAAVAPDKGSINRSGRFASLLKIPALVMEKKRTEHDKVHSLKLMDISGKAVEVKNKNVVLVDDEINTAGTLAENVNVLKKLGVNDIYFAATHAVLSGKAIQRIKKMAVKEIITTDTIRLPSVKKISKLKVLSVADIIARTL